MFVYTYFHYENILTTEFLNKGNRAIEWNEVSYAILYAVCQGVTIRDIANLFETLAIAPLSPPNVNCLSAK